MTERQSVMQDAHALIVRETLELRRCPGDRLLDALRVPGEGTKVLEMRLLISTLIETQGVAVESSAVMIEMAQSLCNVIDNQRQTIADLREQLEA